MKEESKENLVCGLCAITSVPPGMVPGLHLYGAGQAVARPHYGSHRNVGLYRGNSGQMQPADACTAQPAKGIDRLFDRIGTGHQPGPSDGTLPSGTGNL